MIEKEKNINELEYVLELGKKEVILPDEKERIILKLTKVMRIAAKNLDFETATILRDKIRNFKDK